MCSLSWFTAFVHARMLTDRKKMPELHPQFITDGEATRFVVLPFAEWELLHELLEDAADLRALREAKSQDDSQPSLSLAQVRAQLGLSSAT